MTHPCECLIHLVLRKGCILQPPSQDPLPWPSFSAQERARNRREAFRYFSFGTRPLVRGFTLTMFDEFVKCKEIKQKMLFGRQTFQLFHSMTQLKSSCVHPKSLKLCPTLYDHMVAKTARLLCPWDSPSKDTGVGCPPPGDLPDPGIKPHLLHLLHWQAGDVKAGGTYRQSQLGSQNGLACLDLLIVVFLFFLLLVTKLSLTLCHPMNCSPPDSSVHGIFQAKILEWGAFSFSRGSF